MRGGRRGGRADRDRARRRPPGAAGRLPGRGGQGPRPDPGALRGRPGRRPGRLPGAARPRHRAGDRVLPPSRPVRRPGPRGAARPSTGRWSSGAPAAPTARRPTAWPWSWPPPASPTGRWWPPTSPPPRSPGPGPAATPSAELAGLPADPPPLAPPGPANLWEVDPALRHRVRVERANLTARFPVGPGRCQVVFCRNVLIYLSRTVTESFLDRLADWLAPGGLVFLGYSEAVLAPTPRLRVQRLGPAHALRVVPGTGVRAAPGSGSREGPGGCGQPGHPQNPAGRLRSPTGGPGAGAPGSRAPTGPATASAGASRPTTAAEMAQAGELAARRGDHAEAVAAFREGGVSRPRPPCGLVPARASPSGRSRTGAVPGGPTRPPWPRSNGATRRAVRAGLDGWAADELAGVLRARLGRP